MLHLTIGLWCRCAKDLERLILGRGGEGKIASVGEHLARLHQPVDLVLKSFLHHLRSCIRERLRHGRSGAPTLARVSFVDNNGKFTSPVTTT